jgi:hypothetical protein
MARDYRTETIDALYAIAANDAVSIALLPNRKVMLEDRPGRIKRLVYRAPADFPVLFIHTGTNDEFEVFGADTFEKENNDGIGDALARADIDLDLTYDPNDQATITDAQRSAFETALVAAIRNAGRSEIHERLRNAQARRQQSDPSDKTRRATKIRLSCTYELTAADVLP